MFRILVLFGPWGLFVPIGRSVKIWGILNFCGCTSIRASYPVLWKRSSEICRHGYSDRPSGWRSYDGFSQFQENLLSAGHILLCLVRTCSSSVTGQVFDCSRFFLIWCLSKMFLVHCLCAHRWAPQSRTCFRWGYACDPLRWWLSSPMVCSPLAPVS